MDLAELSSPGTDGKSRRIVPEIVTKSVSIPLTNTSTKAFLGRRSKGALSRGNKESRRWAIVGIDRMGIMNKEVKRFSTHQRVTNPTIYVTVIGKACT